MSPTSFVLATIGMIIVISYAVVHPRSFRMNVTFYLLSIVTFSLISVVSGNFGWSFWDNQSAPILGGILCGTFAAAIFHWHLGGNILSRLVIDLLAFLASFMLVGIIGPKVFPYIQIAARFVDANWLLLFVTGLILIVGSFIVQTLVFAINPDQGSIPRLTASVIFVITVILGVILWAAGLIGGSNQLFSKLFN